MTDFVRYRKVRQITRRLHAALHWLRYHLPRLWGASPGAYGKLRQQALALRNDGDAGAAIRLLERLLLHLEQDRAAGTTQRAERAEVRRELARLYADSDSPVLAADMLHKAAEDLKDAPPAQQAGLARVLDDLATAQSRIGRLDKALATAARGLALHQALADDAGRARNLERQAEILIRQRRHEEADHAYGQATEAAVKAEDPVLVGALHQQRGILHRQRRDYEAAAGCFRQAVDAFAAARRPAEEMQSWDMLATTRVRQGELDQARGDYEHSRRLAEELGDRYHLGINAQHVGILYQKRAERATNPDIRITLLHQAAEFLRRSLDIKREMDNRRGVEASYFQLGVLYWKMGDLEQGEHYLRQATDLAEQLQLTKVYKNYSALAMLARERNDTTAMEHWQTKCDNKVAELKSRRT